ncbi:NAD(P)-dependent dehydrogenase (short-subunit alcohol dehydrogenase family) [Pseudarthrobacter defluvii]|uniref:SDR family oxidoreductase n=1 Tax=Pseudarthrobacter defluvii TaxID=410837 RepID=UPI002787E5D9|nr:SDR family oxidoreductase [Pseudarthrobacter defluvii]MDQ0769420.1 NAD(P)-dependent dehydrogenase (short-subunit alcohol dehydrogenase family) [Pseudarthrobacter defluvii]
METARRVVVVTGASAGIGRASAIAFGRQGDAVALLARGEAGLAGAAAEVEAAGGKALPVPVDVADPHVLDAAAERVERELGPIDVWVNVAFTSVFSRFEEIRPEEFKRVTEVSYLGYVYGTMTALKCMRPRNRGTIVQVGSALAYRGIPLQSAYCGAKHAIQGFNEALRTELLHEHSGIRNTMVQMPAVNTPQFSWVLSRLPHQAQPVPPIYQPEVAARGVVYAAAHPGRREYWVGASTAATLIVNAIMPGLLDRYLSKTGFTSQQTSKPRSPDQPANLWKAADCTHDFGTHGIFDSEASAQLPARCLPTSRPHRGRARGSPFDGRAGHCLSRQEGPWMSLLEVFRAAYGTAELLSPGAVEGFLIGQAPDSHARTFIRVLGARHVLQATVSNRGGTVLHRLGGGVDALHALTMLALAGLDRRRRHAAVASAAIALAFAAGEVRCGSLSAR